MCILSKMRKAMIYKKDFSTYFVKINFMYIIHCPSLIKNNVSKTQIYFRRQVEPTLRTQSIDWFRFRRWRKISVSETSFFN
jgi:hypothetical protein